MERWTYCAPLQMAGREKNDAKANNDTKSEIVLMYDISPDSERS